MRYVAAILLALFFAAPGAKAQPLIAANCDMYATVMGADYPETILCVFVRALCSFYAGEMDAQGLAAALQASRGALGSGPEMDIIRMEYDAAVALRGV